MATLDFEKLLDLASDYAEAYMRGEDPDAEKVVTTKAAVDSPEEEAVEPPGMMDEMDEIMDGGGMMQGDMPDGEMMANEETQEPAGPEEIEPADSFDGNLQLVQDALPEGLFAVMGNPMQEAAWQTAKLASSDPQDLAKRVADATVALWQGGEAYASVGDIPMTDAADPQEVDASVVNMFQGVEGFTADEIAPYWREAWEAEKASHEQEGIYDALPSVAAVAARVVDALRAIFTPPASS